MNETRQDFKDAAGNEIRLMRLTDAALDTLRIMAGSRPELWLDPDTDFSVELEALNLQDYLVPTRVSVAAAIFLPSADEYPDREKHKSDINAWEFAENFAELPMNMMSDPNLLAWLSHFPLHRYGISRWPRQPNASLTNYVRRRYLPSNSTDMAQWSVAGRPLWLVHTARKAAENSGGAFTAKEALQHFADFPEHYHICITYYVLRSNLTLSEYVRALMNEAKGISRRGARKLANTLDAEAGARLLDALTREQLRDLTSSSVERVMSVKEYVSDRHALRSQEKLRVLSLGAGVQSSVMALMANEGYRGMPKPDFAIFADTGWEPKAVYDHLEWLESQLDYEVVRVSAGNIKENTINGINPQGRKFIDMPVYVIKDDGKKYIGTRTCTKEYKVFPIRDELRRRLGLAPGEVCPIDKQVEMWLGITTDEAAREKESRDRWITNVYPLIDAGYSRAQLYAWFSERFPDRVLPKSACIGCPYHADNVWKEMKENDPVSFADAVNVDWAIRNMPQARGALKGEAFLHNLRIPLSEIEFSTDLQTETQRMEEECEGLCGI